jgi:hypothetical protein
MRVIFYRIIFYAFLVTAALGILLPPLGALMGWK